MSCILYDVSRTSNYPLYDKLLDGRLDEMLRAARAEGLSFAATRDRLRDDHGVDVSEATVRRWLAPRGEDAP